MSSNNGVDLEAFKEMATQQDMQAAAMQGAIAMAMNNPARITTVGQCGMAIATNPQGMTVLQFALISGERIDVPLPAAGIAQLHAALGSVLGGADDSEE